MVYCGYCAKNISQPDYADGKICCPLCGRVLDEDNFLSDPTFVKDAAGQERLWVLSKVSIQLHEKEHYVKRLCTKINYDLLEKLFDDSEILQNPKKSRNVDDSTNHNERSKIFLEVDEIYEEPFVQYDEDMRYDEDVGGYDYDQHYGYDDEY